MCPNTWTNVKFVVIVNCRSVRPVEDAARQKILSGKPLTNVASVCCTQFPLVNLAPV